MKIPINVLYNIISGATKQICKKRFENASRSDKAAVVMELDEQPDILLE